MLLLLLLVLGVCVFVIVVGVGVIIYSVAAAVDAGFIFVVFTSIYPSYNGCWRGSITKANQENYEV